MRLCGCSSTVIFNGSALFIQSWNLGMVYPLFSFRTTLSCIYSKYICHEYINKLTKLVSPSTTCNRKLFSPQREISSPILIINQIDKVVLLFVTFLLCKTAWHFHPHQQMARLSHKYTNYVSGKVLHRHFLYNNNSWKWINITWKMGMPILYIFTLLQLS